MMVTIIIKRPFTMTRRANYYPSKYLQDKHTMLAGLRQHEIDILKKMSII